MEETAGWTDRHSDRWARTKMVKTMHDTSALYNITSSTCW